MKDLKGKKLLILGGNPASKEIVNEAKKLGVYTIVTDWYDTKRSPAKLIADEYWNEEVFRPDILSNLIKEKGVDGIFTGYTDSYLIPYVELGKMSSLPYWGTHENIRMSITKDLFKEACKKSGVPVVPWKKVNAQNYVNELSDLEPPMVFKPVDNSGSRGVFKCYRKEDILSLCEHSLEYSQSKEVLVERLMNSHNEFSVYYIMDQGQIYLTGMGDRYVYEINSEVAPVGQGMLFPSTRLGQWIKEMDPLLKQFFKDNEMNNGFVFVQGFYEEGKFYIHEIGYRLNGGFSFKLVEHFCNYNQVHQLVRFSLTGKMDENEIKKRDPYFGGGIGMIMTVSMKKGKVSHVEGVEEIKKMPGVVQFYQLKEIGDEITSEGTTAEAFAYIMLAASSKDTLKTLINKIKASLHVNDEQKNNMIIPLIDPDRLRFND